MDKRRCKATSRFVATRRAAKRQTELERVHSSSLRLQPPRAHPQTYQRPSQKNTRHAPHASNRRRKTQTLHSRPLSMRTMETTTRRCRCRKQSDDAVGRCCSSPTTRFLVDKPLRGRRQPARDLDGCCDIVAALTSLLLFLLELTSSLTSSSLLLLSSSSRQQSRQPSKLTSTTSASKSTSTSTTIAIATRRAIGATREQRDHIAPASDTAVQTVTTSAAARR